MHHNPAIAVFDADNFTGGRDRDLRRAKTWLAGLNIGIIHTLDDGTDDDGRPTQ